MIFPRGLLQGGNKHDAATNYVDACTCYKKSDPNQAAASLQKAIDIYTGMRYAFREFMITVICHVFKVTFCKIFTLYNVQYLFVMVNVDLNIQISR
jgi:hypothetical protein